MVLEPFQREYTDDFEIAESGLGRDSSWSFLPELFPRSVQLAHGCKT